MDCSNPFDAFLPPGIGDPPSGFQTNSHIDRSITSRDSNISEVYNDYSQQPLSQARTFYSDPYPRRTSNLNVPRNILRDTDHYPYESSHG